MDVTSKLFHDSSYEKFDLKLFKPSRMTGVHKVELAAFTGFVILLHKYLSGKVFYEFNKIILSYL